jgi:hypothetical protein
LLLDAVCLDACDAVFFNTYFGFRAGQGWGLATPFTAGLACALGFTAEGLTAALPVGLPVGLPVNLPVGFTAGLASFFAAVFAAGFIGSFAAGFATGLATVFAPDLAFTVGLLTTLDFLAGAFISCLLAAVARAFKVVEGMGLGSDGLRSLFFCVAR